MQIVSMKTPGRVHMPKKQKLIKPLLLLLIFFFSSSVSNSGQQEAEYASSGLIHNNPAPEPHRDIRTDEGADSIHFTDAEKLWLKNHHTIRIGGPRVFPPFYYFDADGNAQGIASDYIRYIFDRLKLTADIQEGLFWPDVLKKAEKKEIDLIPLSGKSADREKYLIFTNPYLSFPLVIITRVDAPFVGGIHDLDEKKIAFIQGNVSYEWIMRDKIGVIPYFVNTTLEELQAVSYGDADGCIENLAAATYIIQKYGLANLKIAAPTPYANYNLYIAVRNDWPELVSVINKILSAMTAQQKSDIQNKWLAVRYEYGIRQSDVLKWILSIIVISAAVLSGILFWNRKLNKQISERKKVEEALRESENSFSQLFESAPIPMAFASEIDNYRGTTWNGAWYHTFGYARDLAGGRSGNDIGLWVVPEERDRFVEMAKRQNYVAHFETRLRHCDGSVLSCSLFGRFIEKSGHRLLMVVYLDVSERKRAEDALRESEEKFRLTFSASPDAVNINRLEDGLYVDVNEGFTRATGFTREDVMGRTSLEINIWENPEDREKLVLGLREKGYYENLETKFRRKDGSLITALMSVKIIHLHGVPHIISISRDISELKALTARIQQVQRLEAAGSLAGGVAHDFNNLLMGIQGRVSLLSLGTDAGSPHLEHLQAIEEYIRSATNLTKQLLGLARGGKYEVVPIDINELVAASSTMFGRTRKEIRMHMLCPESPLVADADRGQIEQVLLNMYINAWQAMPATGGDIHIETRIVELDASFCMPHQIEPGSYIKISVTDTGSGMDEATRLQVFDPFFTTKDKGRGTGLGLASAYGIVKNHGGTVTVYSQIGIGTTFNIYLPRSLKQPVPQLPVQPRILKGTETILLVDDEDLIIDVGKAILENLGYEVIIGKNGQEAVQKIAELGNRIDLVILDLIMPGMDGGHCFDRIRQIQPNVPVLLSSGYSINSQADSIMSRGCNGFIQKPYNLSELSQKVREVLDGCKGPDTKLSPIS